MQRIGSMMILLLVVIALVPNHKQIVI